jgi:hypothetical protein
LPTIVAGAGLAASAGRDVAENKVHPRPHWYSIGINLLAEPRPKGAVLRDTTTTASFGRGSASSRRNAPAKHQTKFSGIAGCGAGIALAMVDADEILNAFPRLKFKDAFTASCADVVRKHPRGAGQPFTRDIRDRYLPEFHPVNFCDRIAKAPYSE